MFFITMTWVPTIPVTNPTNSNNIIQDNSSPVDVEDDEQLPVEQSHPDNVNHYNLADNDPADGILDPVLVEQSGYAASANISARTDSYQNLGYDLPLDIDHNWTADVAEVSVWNLEKLYAVNGTFDLGLPGVNVNPNGTVDYYPLGWSANSTDTATYSDDVQLAAYDDSGRQYVMVENQGGKVGQNAFGHEAGTRIVWTQTVQNAPYTEDFLLDFDYFYLRGPLDKNPGVPVPITGNCSITVSIDGATVWNMSLLTLSQRGVWANSGVIPIDITGAPASFTFEIGLVIDESLTLDKRYDYDGNGIDDGIGNAAYITVYLDDVSFIKATPPTAEQVQLEFTTGGTTSALTGSMGTYYTSITNSSYWDYSPVSVVLTSNTSVSFDYKTRLHSHRFTDSNWRTDISSVGVSYVVDHGLSSDLSFYTYVGYLGGYEEPEMMIVFPNDWENITVSDPFLTDLTGSCTIGSGYLIAPTSIIDRLGWWEIKLESPNYAKSIKPQIFDGGWSDNALFRIGNTTQAAITIGTDTEVMGSLADVNIVWFSPSDQIWNQNTISGGTLGQITTPSMIFNSSSPAGEWWMKVYWTNGTEVAYDRSNFALWHSADLVAEPSEITTEAGLTVKGILRYTDAETPTNILDTSASVVANWSGSTIPFVANPVQNWWESDFDTSLTGAGDFVIVVNATRPYYDDINCQILVHSVNVTRLISPNAPWTAAEWGNIVPLTFNFQSYDLATKTWGPVRDTGDVTVHVNWTDGYWSISESAEAGVYIMDLNTNGVTAGTWLLNTTFSKPYHESKTILLTLILSPMTSSLAVSGELSERVDIEAPTLVKLRYTLSNGTPITGANVVVDSVSPAGGLAQSVVSEVGGEPGNYTVTLTPYVATVYTVRFVATEANSEPASTVFVLVVNDVQTNLMIYGDSSLEIGLSDTYNTTFRYEMINGTGIASAAIDIVYSGPIGKLGWNLSEISLGNYSVEFAASLPGTYLITIAAFKQYHQSSSDSFFLTISNIPTELQIPPEPSVEIGLTDTYDMSVRYQMDNGTGIEGATFEVIADEAIGYVNTSLGLGDYSFEFNSTSSGTFLITVAASKQYHQSDSRTFFLVVREISTNMTSLNSTSALVGFRKDYRLVISYTNSSGFGLDGANVSIANVVPTTGLTWDTTVPEGNGVYSILLNSTTANTFNILIGASYPNHQTQFLLFTLTTTAIATTLSLLNASTSIALDQNYTLYMLYQDEDSNALENATITPQGTIGVALSEFEEVSGGVYKVTIYPQEVGIFDLIFRASKPGYQNDSVSFTLGATRIPTNLRIASGLSSDSMIFSDEYQMVLYYWRTDTLVNVTSADIDVQGVPSTGFIWSVEAVSDGYAITIDPEHVGTWKFTLTAQLEGYASSSLDFILTVNAIEVHVEILSSLVVTEGQPFNITARLTEVHSGNPVTGALVSFRLSPVGTSSAGDFIQMEETNTPGVYIAYRRLPLFLATSQYNLEIKVEKDNYFVPGEFFVQSFLKENDSLVRATPFIFGGGTFFVGFMILVGVMRVRSGRRKRQLEVDIANKNRFDDADNIIGVIVMHKNSGIPIYSRIVKGGFEEGIVAAFISAVTHFREEFEMLEEQKMQVIPISDIIRAVQTENLICAFITIKSASIEHNRKMESFAQQVATYLDDFYTESRPSGALDSRIAEILDYIYDETMDGKLIKFYKAAEDKDFPRRYRYLEQLLEDIETRHCARPVHMAQGVATFGVSEAHGCTLILEAIDKGLIEQCETHEPTVEDTEFADFFKGNSNTES